MSAALLRVAARGPSSALRANLAAAAARPQPAVARAGLAASSSFSTSVRMRSEHKEETFEEFTAR